MKESKVLNLIIWQEGKLYVAQSLEFGIASQGTTYDKAVKNIKEAIKLYLEEDKEARDEVQYFPEIKDLHFEQVNTQSLQIHV